MAVECLGSEVEAGDRGAALADEVLGEAAHARAARSIDADHLDRLRLTLALEVELQDREDLDGRTDGLDFRPGCSFSFIRAIISFGESPTTWPL